MKLDGDFSSLIYDEDHGEETHRIIKIQCSGVAHRDIKLCVNRTTFNGVEVIINRKPSIGQPAATWKKEFQSRPSEGLFEVREEKMTLEQGILTLVLQPRPFADRTIRFPEHYSMDVSDGDSSWLCPSSATGGSNESNSS